MNVKGKDATLTMTPHYDSKDATLTMTHDGPHDALTTHRPSRLSPLTPCVANPGALGTTGEQIFLWCDESNLRVNDLASGSSVRIVA